MANLPEDRAYYNAQNGIHEPMWPRYLFVAAVAFGPYIYYWWNS